MAQNSPNIIFNIKAFLPGNNSSENDFIRCKSSFDLLSYLNRKNAVERFDESTEQIIKDYFELTGKCGDILGYGNNRPGSTGAFTKGKFIQPEELGEYREKLSKTNSVIWSTVLSFTPMIAAQYCADKFQAQSIIENNIAALCKNSKLDVENLEWIAFLHQNTEHPHIHFVFWEKEPTHINSRGAVGYNYTNPRLKGHLPLQAIDDFKFSVANSFNENKLDYLSLRDEIRHTLRDDISAQSLTVRLLYAKQSDIFESDKKQYARFSAENQRRIDYGVKCLISNNPELKKKYDSYVRLLLETHNQNIKLYTDNNMPVPQNATEFFDSRMKELCSRLGNEYLKSMQHWFNIDTQKKSAEKTVPLPFRGQSSSSYMRALRKARKPFKDTTGGILTAFEKAVDNEVTLSRNNLDAYFKELQAKGVDLIYAEKEKPGTEEQAD